MQRQMSEGDPTAMADTREAAAEAVTTTAIKPEAKRKSFLACAPPPRGVSPPRDVSPPWDVDTGKEVTGGWGSVLETRKKAEGGACGDGEGAGWGGNRQTPAQRSR